jgi:hypothetical protein
VLISPIALLHPTWEDQTLPVAITQAQVKNSPSIDTDQPVSRQNEQQVLGYYGYPGYWGGAGLWGEGLYPEALAPAYAGPRLDRAERDRQQLAWFQAERALHRHDDPHLRSGNVVAGYGLHANDGNIGHVEDFLVDDETWAIRYLVVNTGHWWSGHQVLVAPAWITGVHWSDKSVSVDLTRESIKQSPLYDPSAEMTREWESRLYLHHGRRSYWADIA